MVSIGHSLICSIKRNKGNKKKGEIKKQPGKPDGLEKQKSNRRGKQEHVCEKRIHLGHGRVLGYCGYFYSGNGMGDFKRGVGYFKMH